MVDLATDDEARTRPIDRFLEVQHEALTLTLEAGRGRPGVLWMGEDLGAQRSPLVSRAISARHIRRRHQRFVELGRAWGLPVVIHTCGPAAEPATLMSRWASAPLASLLQPGRGRGGPLCF